MSYILDNLRDLGVQEIVFVVGYLRDAVRKYIKAEYPDFTAHFVVQEVQDGTAGAIQLAEPFIDEEVLIVFGDTLFDADLSLVQRLSDDWAGVIWTKEVEDYQRFGVILTDEAGAMTRIVEKPTKPVSKVANIGLYHIRDWRLLFEGVHHVLGSDPEPGGEYFLTDAFQYMVDRGARICTAPVGGWYDCGKTKTLLETNRHLVETSRSDIALSATLEGSEVNGAVRVEAGASVLSSVLGANVTVECGAFVENSSLRDCIIGENAVVKGCDLHYSIIGASSHIENLSGSVSVGPHTQVVGVR